MTKRVICLVVLTLALVPFPGSWLIRPNSLYAEEVLPTDSSVSLEPYALSPEQLAQAQAHEQQLLAQMKVIPTAFNQPVPTPAPIYTEITPVMVEKGKTELPPPESVDPTNPEKLEGMMRKKIEEFAKLNDGHWADTAKAEEKMLERLKELVDFLHNLAKDQEIQKMTFQFWRDPEGKVHLSIIFHGPNGEKVMVDLSPYNSGGLSGWFGDNAVQANLYVWDEEQKKWVKIGGPYDLGTEFDQLEEDLNKQYEQSQKHME